MLPWWTSFFTMCLPHTNESPESNGWFRSLLDKEKRKKKRTWESTLCWIMYLIYFTPFSACRISKDPFKFQIFMDLFVIQRCSVSTYYLFVFLVKWSNHVLMVTWVIHCCVSWLDDLSTLPRKKEMSIWKLL